MALITRVCVPICSRASCSARALITVASMPMWSAVTRSIFRAAAATPRKKLPPPTTTPTWMPARATSATSIANAFTRSASIPNFSSPAITSPLSFSRMREYCSGAGISTWRAPRRRATSWIKVAQNPLLVSHFETDKSGHADVFTQLGDAGLDQVLDRHRILFHKRLLVEAYLFVKLGHAALDDLVGDFFRLALVDDASALDVL